MKFISKEECEILGLGADQELLNEILSRIHNSAVETAIRKIPDALSRLMKSTAAIQGMTADFFKRNKEFENHKDIVAKVIQDVESLHPGWSYDEVLKEAEGVIKFKIECTNKKEDLPLDKPDIVNLKGNGIL